MSTVSSPRALSVSLETVATGAALAALRAEWERLWRIAQGTPFQSPAWLLPWWTHIGRGELASLAMRDAHTRELCGFAPLYVWRDDVGLRHLFPLGIATTDHIDALAAPGREDEVAQGIASHVAAIADRWDVFEVPQLRPEALLLRCRWPVSWQCELREDEPHPVLVLPARVPHALARSIAYSARRAEDDGGFVIEAADAASWSGMLDALAALHAMRWSQRGLPGVLGEPGVLDWHREAAPQLLALGLLRLYALRYQGRIVGVAYILADASHQTRRRWYAYIGGFDPRLSWLSPGTLLLGHAIEAATAEGASSFDFLRGAEGYKYRWGAVDEPMHALSVQRASSV